MNEDLTMTHFWVAMTMYHIEDLMMWGLQCLSVRPGQRSGIQPSVSSANHDVIFMLELTGTTTTKKLIVWNA